MNQYALRIYKDNGELQTAFSTRTGLKLDEKFQIQNDLSEHNGKKFVLFDITEQKEISTGIIGKIENE